MTARHGFEVFLEAVFCGNPSQFQNGVANFSKVNFEVSVNFFTKIYNY